MITDSEEDDVCDVEGDVSESEGEDCSISEEKVNEGGSISDVGKQSLILPPDVWAKVLECELYISSNDMLHCLCITYYTVLDDPFY